MGYTTSTVCDVLHYNEDTDKLALQEVHLRNLHAYPRGEKQTRDVELFENTEDELRLDGSPDDVDTGLVMAVQEYEEDDEGALEVIGAISSRQARLGTKEEVKAGLFQSAIEDEMEKMSMYEVLEPAQHDRLLKPLPTTWVYTWTMNNNDPKPKARLVVRGDLAERTRELYTPLPSAHCRKIAMLFGLHHGYKFAVVDVKSAFLNVPLNEVIYVKVLGKTYRLRKALYGLRQAPRLFVDHLEALLRNRQFECLGPGIFRKEEVILLSYVDDILVMASDPAHAITELKGLIACGDATYLSEAEQVRYVGWNVSLSSAALQLSMKSFTESLDEYAVRGVLSPRDFVFENREADPLMKPRVQCLLGKVGWLATLYPQYAFAFSHLATCPPCPKLVKTLEKLLRDSKNGNLNDVRLVSGECYSVNIWADASFNNTTNEARVGILVQISPADSGEGLDNTVLHRSFKETRVHRSTLSAELSAACEAMSLYEKHRKLIEMFPLKSAVLWTDSRTMVEAVNSGNCKDGYCEGRIKLLKQCLEDSKVSLKWVPTTMQKADMLTKYVSHH